MKSLNIALCLLILMAIPFAAFSQTYLWEEDFATDPGNWTLQANWSVTSGYLQFYYSPTTTDYNLAATSPVITLPNNAGNLLVTQYINYFSYVDEAFEIAVLVGGETDVLWTHGDGTDWGVEAGSLLELSLIEYQGQDIQLRFRSWGTSTWNINWWRIYHLAIEGSFDDDLSTLSITGPASPSINTTANYTIAVRNNGVNNQSDYTVRLMKEGDVEIASIAGEHITTGQTINYTLPWTPTEAGATYLYGEVILENDEVPANNITDNLNVLVMPEGILVATIGTGEEVNVTTGAAPVNIYFRSIRTQSVYTVAAL